MELVDACKKVDEDDFLILLSYKGKYTFTQDECLYKNENSILYDVRFDKSDIYIITEKEDKRCDIFDKLDAFIDTLRKNEDHPEQYSALLFFDKDKLVPICAFDNEANRIFSFMPNRIVQVNEDFKIGEVLQSLSREKKDLIDILRWIISKFPVTITSVEDL